MPLDSIAPGMILIFLVVVCAAGFLHGAVGFGFPLLSTPLLAAVTDVRTAILLTLFPTIAVNIASIVGEGAWEPGLRRYWPVALFAGAGSVAGSLLLVHLDPEPFRLVLAALILLYLVVQRRPDFHLGFITRRRWLGMGLFGTAAGLAGGTSNVMLPVMVIYGLELGFGAAVLVPLFNLCFLAGKLSQVAVFAQAGLLGMSMLRTGLLLALPSVSLLLAGRQLRKRIHAEAYRQFLRWLLVALAVMLVIQYFV